MKFEQLLDIMHCDFFELQKNGETVRYADRYDRSLKAYYNDNVCDFYTVKNNNETGLLIRLY